MNPNFNYVDQNTKTLDQNQNTVGLFFLDTNMFCGVFLSYPGPIPMIMIFIFITPETETHSSTQPLISNIKHNLENQSELYIGLHP